MVKQPTVRVPPEHEHDAARDPHREQEISDKVSDKDGHAGWQTVSARSHPGRLRSSPQPDYVIVGRADECVMEFWRHSIAPLLCQPA